MGGVGAEFGESVMVAVVGRSRRSVGSALIEADVLVMPSLQTVKGDQGRAVVRGIGAATQQARIFGSPRTCTYMCLEHKAIISK